MKIIDIFNKITNDEEVPKKVKFNDKIYTYKPEWKDYADKEEKCGLFVDVISNTYQITQMLNEELEIIEEDKKIKNVNLRYIVCKSDLTDNHIVELLNKFFRENDDKINELIDEVNKLKEVK